MNQYLEYVQEQLADLGSLRSRKMFGGIGLYADDLFFGLIASDVLYLKVDETNRADYEEHESEPFRPYADSDRSMSYWELPVSVLEKPAEAVSWARRSVEIARQAAKLKRKKSRRKTSKTAAAKRASPKLGSLRNLGPQSARWLADVGLETRADLERVGSLGAYRKVCEHRGKSSLNLLYALEAALLDVHWTELPPPLKERLKAAVK